LSRTAERLILPRLLLLSGGLEQTRIGQKLGESLLRRHFLPSIYR
jgi:hypothetical protein